MNETLWKLTVGNNRLVAAAIHNGHDIREEISELLALDEASRLHEEDPFTGEWTVVAETRFVAFRSRFEVDLNRPREKAVYIHPEDAWGLKVWKSNPSNEFVQRSLEVYDTFYEEMKNLFSDLVSKFDRFIVFDLHTYNHRRNGPGGPASDPEENPEVNIGTGTMDRDFWSPIVDRFISDLRNFDFLGRKLDVRENVRFRGGNFPRWIHENFPKKGCALAIEFKKFFMDEWTGIPDRIQLAAISDALKSTVPGILGELEKF
ncbi:MAG: N-formylglutamate amidohydrolase [Thermodesulfobacteriota bacterium]